MKGVQKSIPRHRIPGQRLRRSHGTAEHSISSYRQGHSLLRQISIEIAISFISVLDEHTLTTYMEYLYQPVRTPRILVKDSNPGQIDDPSMGKPSLRRDIRCSVCQLATRPLTQTMLVLSARCYAWRFCAKVPYCHNDANKSCKQRMIVYTSLPPEPLNLSISMAYFSCLSFRFCLWLRLYRSLFLTPVFIILCLHL